MILIKTLIFSILFSFASMVNAANTSYVSDVRYLHVQKGQTLHNIVKRLYPNKIKQWPSITKELVRINPHAFIKNDPTRMKADVRLTLPSNTIKKAQAAKKVGSVATSSGSVIAVNKSKVSRKLFTGAPVFLGDKVITGEDGSVRLHMIDDAILDLRCYSIMVIEEYALNPSNRRSIVNLLQGSLRKVTGQIGKMSKDVYELKTPVASVGVRGTEYAVRVFQSKGCSGTIDTDNGLYLEVIKGLVDVHNAKGTAVIAKGETAYVPLPDSIPKKGQVKPGVLHPLSNVVEPVNQSAEEETSYWWWLLGIAAIALLI